MLFVPEMSSDLTEEEEVGVAAAVAEDVTEAGGTVADALAAVQLDAEMEAATLAPSTHNTHHNTRYNTHHNTHHNTRHNTRTMDATLAHSIHKSRKIRAPSRLTQD